MKKYIYLIILLLSLNNGAALANSFSCTSNSNKRSVKLSPYHWYRDDIHKRSPYKPLCFAYFTDENALDEVA